MKLLVLAQDGASTWMLVNALRPQYPGLQVGLERPVANLTMIMRRARRKGAWAVFGQLLFIACAPLLCWDGRARRRTLSAAAGLDTNQPEVPITRFESANSDACIAWLAAEKPDVVVINGTRILSPAVLSSCGAIFLNIHCGITPAYRGVHGGYWALYQGDSANAGVTVHVVDPGIDTGDIVYQKTIVVDDKDSFPTYPVKQYIAGVELMRKALRDIAEGKLATTARHDLRSAIWQHPTLWQYLSARWTRGVR